MYSIHGFRGWPEKSPDLKYFYPTDLLVTGPDIIFFWVARMIMAGLEFVHEIPFKDVLLNGIVRDEKGRKMSKSLGNGIDPLEMIDKFSADAVRFTVVMLSSEGQDINLSKNHFEMGRNFSNKIWNAYRFLNMHLKEIDCDYLKYKNHFELSDLWIISRFQKTIKELNQNLEHFKVNEGLNTTYHFFWHDYCDWYLELIKKRLYQETDDVNKQTALAIASYIMKEIMNLLHPYIPFITEEVWQRFKCQNETSIVIADWPKYDEVGIDENAEQNMLRIQNAISSIRNVRAEMNVPPGKMAPLFIRASKKNKELINNHYSYFNSLAKVENIQDYNEKLDNIVKATAVVEDTELFIPLAELIDVDIEKARLSKEIRRLESINKGIEAKLQNKNFISKAPEEIVLVEKEKLQNNENKLNKLYENLNRLK
jgi:valyl-tRNA synthetase